MVDTKVSPSPEVHKVKALYDLKCPTRDGTELSTDVFMPAEGGPFPTILLRSPYDNHLEQDMPNLISLAKRGYAVATQDVRGRYDSPGEWYPFLHEASDGHDAVEWCASQPWSTGKVGTVGDSYRGLTQWQEAQGASPHLVASVPRVAYSNVFHNWVYTGGAFQLAFNLTWCISMSTNTSQASYLWFPPEMHLSTLYRHLPLVTSDEASGRTIRHWKDWVNHPTYGDYWSKFKPVDEHYEDIEVASYSQAGWFDVFLQGSLNNFIGMTTKARSEKARRNQKLIVGPWVHQLGTRGTDRTTGDVDFGPEVLFDLEEEVRWMDYWLKGTENGIVDEPRVKLFVMGATSGATPTSGPCPRPSTPPTTFTVEAAPTPSSATVRWTGRSRRRRRPTATSTTPTTPS